jgi:hypothetical protein
LNQFILTHVLSLGLSEDLSSLSDLFELFFLQAPFFLLGLLRELGGMDLVDGMTLDILDDV